MLLGPISISTPDSVFVLFQSQHPAPGRVGSGKLPSIPVAVLGSKMRCASTFA